MKPIKAQIVAFIDRYRQTFTGKDATIFAFLAELYLSRSRGSRANSGRRITNNSEAARKNREAVARHRANKRG